MSLLVTGTVALDTVETPFGKIEEGLGGSATHFSASASYHTQVNIVAVVGEDFPKAHLDFLQTKGIDIKGIEIVPGKTFRWSGRYDYDLSNPETLETQLNVLQEFNPSVPDDYQGLDYLFLANIHPLLQRRVIEAQKQKPKLIACDTMNFWIEGERDALLETIKKVDLLSINEGEARLLSKESNLVKASRVIREMGPQTLLIKQGEYGALLFQDDRIFSAPGLPIEDIKDPTGAGDSFAGGFMGYLAKTNDLSFENMKKAVIYGSVMASFNVEAFSCDRLKNLSDAEIATRYDIFKSLAHFDS